MLIKNSGKSRRGGRVLAVAAAVAVVGLAGTAIAIAFRDSDRSDPGNQSPPAPTTATTIPSSTAPSTQPSTVPPTVPPPTVAALSDGEIANATLLAAGEYGPGFVPLALTGTAPWGAGMKMDSAIAERVPACAPFIDAFESPSREAAVAYTFFNTQPPDPPSPEPQYVVVFPDEQAAQAMFEAITDPAFLDGCVSGYHAQMTDPEFGDPEFVWFPFFITTTELDPPELDLSADQSLVRAYTDQPDAQTTRFVAATVRVGRVVAHVDGETQDANGDPVLTPDQLQQLVSTIIDRARTALTGQPRPVTVPPSTTTAPTTTTAVVLPLTLDPDVDDPDFVGELPTSALVDAVEAITSLHGLGHETFNGWISDGIVLMDGSWIEPLVGCAGKRMFDSHDWYGRAADTRSALISAGVPETEITQDRIVSQMTSDDPAVFAFDPAEYKFFLLTCAGMPDGQAQVIASM